MATNASMYEPDKLREKFQEKYTERRDEWEQGEVAEIVRILSRSIGAMQEAGIDVGLEMRPSWSQESFAMVFNNFSGTAMIYAQGELRVGNATFLLGIGRSQDLTRTTKGPDGAETKRDACVLFLSEDDIDFQGGDEKVRSKFYDVIADDAGIREFQERVLYFAAGQKLIEDYDTQRAFASDGSGTAKVKASKFRIGG